MWKDFQIRITRESYSRQNVSQWSWKVKSVGGRSSENGVWRRTGNVVPVIFLVYAALCCFGRRTAFFLLSQYTLRPNFYRHVAASECVNVCFKNSKWIVHWWSSNMYNISFLLWSSASVVRYGDISLSILWRWAWSTFFITFCDIRNG